MKNCGFWKCFGMVVAQVHEMAEKSLNVDIILILAAQVLQSQRFYAAYMTFFKIIQNCMVSEKERFHFIISL